MASAINPADFGFFSTLITAGSLAAAARELGISTPAVSKRLAQMESRLKLTLVNRNTRRMGLTPEGELYLERARRILNDIDDLEHLLWGATQAPKGLLRVNATLGFGRSYVAPLISRFVEQFPEVDVQLQLSVVPPALTEDAFDVCVRFGPPAEARVVARFLASNRRVLCAAPAYLARHGTPKVPQDLAQHNCLGIRQGDEYGIWRFSNGRPRGKGKERMGEQTVRIRGNLTTNDGGVAVSWALEGRGIVMRAEWDVADYLREGKLVRILPAYETPDADVYAMYPQQQRSSTRVKAFVDFLSASFNRP